MGVSQFLAPIGSLSNKSAFNTQAGDISGASTLYAKTFSDGQEQYTFGGGRTMLELIAGDVGENTLTVIAEFGALGQNGWVTGVSE